MNPIQNKNQKTKNQKRYVIPVGRPLISKNYRHTHRSYRVSRYKKTHPDTEASNRQIANWLSKNKSPPAIQIKKKHIIITAILQCCASLSGQTVQCKMYTVLCTLHNVHQGSVKNQMLKSRPRQLGLDRKFNFKASLC